MGKLRVLFQGDSITDMGRDRGDIRNMGSGYPLFVASNFRAARPNFDIDFFDLGISGDRVRDLRARWQSDCLDLRPDVLSVLIGINDTWRTPRIQRSSSACTARCSRTRGAKIRALK